MRSLIRFTVVECLIADNIELIHMCMNMTCEQYVDIIHAVQR